MINHTTSMYIGFTWWVQQQRILLLHVPCSVYSILYPVSVNINFCPCFDHSQGTEECEPALWRSSGNQWTWLDGYFDATLLPPACRVICIRQDGQYLFPKQSLQKKKLSQQLGCLTKQTNISVKELQSSQIRRFFRKQE